MKYIHTYSYTRQYLAVNAHVPSCVVHLYMNACTVDPYLFKIANDCSIRVFCVHVYSI